MVVANRLNVTNQQGKDKWAKFVENCPGESNNSRVVGGPGASG